MFINARTLFTFYHYIMMNVLNGISKILEQCLLKTKDQYTQYKSSKVGNYLKISETFAQSENETSPYMYRIHLNLSLGKSSHFVIQPLGDRTDFENG